MTQKTVAEIFIETLIAAGVARIYGVVGDSLNGIVPASTSVAGKNRRV
jgi:pyruvate dehydrogenase (quinone)